MRTFDRDLMTRGNEIQRIAFVTLLESIRKLEPQAIIVRLYKSFILEETILNMSMNTNIKTVTTLATLPQSS